MKQSFKFNTIDRVIAVMHYLASTDSPKKLSEIGRQLKLSKASTFRILHSLEKGEWVYCDPDTDTYRVGYKILELGLALLSNTTIATIGERFLPELRNITGETVALSIRVGNERMFIREMQSNSELRFISPLGKRLPLWKGAVGKAILANMKESEIDSILNNFLHTDLPYLATGELLDIKKLRQELFSIRKQGCAVSTEERDPGVTAVAAPLFNHYNEVIGAISIAGPCDRFNKEKVDHYCTLIKEFAENMTRQMGSTINLQITSSQAETPPGKSPKTKESKN